MASYPGAIWSVPTRNTGDVITANFFNDPNNEIIAVETDLINGVQVNLLPLTDNTKTVGSSTKRFVSGAFASFLAIGTNPAASGALRLANASAITWRDSDNAADYNVLAGDSSDNVTIGTEGGTQLKFIDIPSIVNFLQFAGTATGSDPTLSVQGDTNRGLVVLPRGTGSINLGTSALLPFTSTATSGTPTLFNVWMGANPGSASTATYVGQQIQTSFVGSNVNEAGTTLVGTTYNTFHGGAAGTTLPLAIGIANNIGANAAATAILTTAIGMRISRFTSDAATTTNTYGIHIQDLAIAPVPTLAYGILFDTSPNYFAPYAPIRFANAQGPVFRNAAGTADLRSPFLDGSNNLNLGIGTGKVFPNGDGGLDLGSTGNRFNDCFLAGDVKNASGVVKYATAPTITLKKGSATGTDYTTASTTYVDVDATNLAFTVTIPTGQKLTVVATVPVFNSTATNGVSLRVVDGTNAVAELQVVPTSSVTPISVALATVIVGDGASHVIKLQYAANATTAHIANAALSTTTTPALGLAQMLFTMQTAS